MVLINNETGRPISADSVSFYGIDGFVECLRGNKGLFLLLALPDVGADGKFKLRKSLKSKYASAIGITEASVYRIFRQLVRCGVFICDEDKQCYINPLIAFSGDRYKRIDAIRRIVGIDVKYFKYGFEADEYLRKR